jgi:DNA-binding MurR/RpiR family transcriptional regulator
MQRAIVKLENYLEDCTSSERNAVLYLVQNTKEALNQDIHTISKLCFCSSATIVRIAKKNGYSGFKELKRELYKDLSYLEDLDKYDLDTIKKEDTSVVIIDITNNNIRAIKQTVGLLDNNTLLAVVDLIKNNQHINLFGIGASFIACKDLQMKLERVDKNTTLYEDTHMQYIRSSNIHENELAIIISYSGETEEILKMATNIKKNNGVIISIVKYGRTDLSDLSDYVLFVPAFEQELRVSASSSRISQLNMIDIIYHSYLKEVYDVKIKNILETSRMLKKKSKD